MAGRRRPHPLAPFTLPMQCNAATTEHASVYNKQKATLDSAMWQLAPFVFHNHRLPVGSASTPRFEGGSLS